MFIDTKLYILTLFVCSFETGLSQETGKCLTNVTFMLDLMKKPTAERWQAPAGFQTTEDLIRRNGFGYEGYRVITEDGYILALHRILTNRTGAQPILMVHGLFMSTDAMLMAGRKADIVFQLADAGFDVWMGDHRGNWYSREHVKYKPNSRKFWDFSFHESGVYDLPAFIDKILNATGYSKVFTVGESMGCNAILAMLTMRPEYNDKIILTILLAPVAMIRTLAELESPFIKFLYIYGEPLLKYANSTGLLEVFARETLFMETVKNCCAPSTYQQACMDLFGFIFGEHRTNYAKVMNEKTARFVAGTSLKTLYHMWQLIQGEFTLFNYGRAENLRRYNSTKPPNYPLEKITSPVAIYWSESDVFVNENTIYKTARRLPNIAQIYKVPDTKFTHFDFIWGLNTPALVNTRIIELMKRYT